jgi:PAS domain S-box-containing protein
MTQAFVASTAFATLTLAASVRQWRVALDSLQRARGGLEHRVSERTLELQVAVQELARSQQALALHVQQTPLGVIEWGPDFRVAAWNPAAERIFGWTRAEVLGRHADDFVPPAARPHVARVWAELVANRGGARSTNPNVTRDGRTIDCEWFNTPLFDDTGAFVGVASFVADVTARVEAEAERDRLLVAYRAAIASRDEFLSVASHELRTPVTSLQLAVQSLMRGSPRRAPLDEATQRMLGAVERQTQRLGLLVNDLLDVSRVREGRLRLDLHEHDVAAIVRDTVASLQGDLAVSGTTITVDADRPAPARVDAARVGQVVTNLCTNAIKYGAGKPVHVRVDLDGDEVVVGVADQGIGIDADDQGRVFERYARAVSPRHYSGFGLGLHIVRGLVEAHGGRIELQSEPGVGSTFTVRLPCAGPPEAPEPREGTVPTA